MYTFLNNNNIIYNLRFGFRQHYFTFCALLINISENIWKAPDDGNTGCKVFVDLQKAFDTVDHQILLAKSNLYGICGVSNNWFKSHLSYCNHKMLATVKNSVIYMVFSILPILDLLSLFPKFLQRTKMQKKYRETGSILAVYCVQ